MRIKRTTRPAFSLLEMVLALAIGMVLLATLYMTLNIQITTTQAGRDTIEGGTKARFILARISSDIMGQLSAIDPRMLPANALTSYNNSSGNLSTTTTTSPSAGGASGAGASSSTGGSSSSSGASGSTTMQTPTPPVLFNIGIYGTTDTLRISTYRTQPTPPDAFTSNIDTSIPVVSDIRRITYWFATGNSESQGLARKDFAQAISDDIDYDPTSLTDQDKCVIAKEVTSLKFQYLNFDALTWQDDWDGTLPGADGETPVGPPLAIKVTITLRRGKTGSQPQVSDPTNDPSFTQVIAFPGSNNNNQYGNAPTP